MPADTSSLEDSVNTSAEQGVAVSPSTSVSSIINSINPGENSLATKDSVTTESEDLHKKMDSPPPEEVEDVPPKPEPEPKPVEDETKKPEKTETNADEADKFFESEARTSMFIQDILGNTETAAEFFSEITQKTAELEAETNHKVSALEAASRAGAAVISKPKFNKINTPSGFAATQEWVYSSVMMKEHFEREFWETIEGRRQKAHERLQQNK